MELRPFRIAPTQLSIVATLALALAWGCGGSDAPKPGWTPRADVQDFNGDVAPGDSIKRAEAVVRHQREDHCGQRLIKVRCNEEATSWLCEWRTDKGSGETSLKKHPLNGGIPVTCG